MILLRNLYPSLYFEEIIEDEKLQEGEEVRMRVSQCMHLKKMHETWDSRGNG